MALFVHLTSQKDAVAIRRSGIRARLTRYPIQGYNRIVFAMPVTNNFFISHQWLRELKRNGQRTYVGVYFRIPDDQKVLIGHYGRAHMEMTASEATGVIFHEENAEGYEVIIARKIEASDVHSIRVLPQVLGWRYSPNAHRSKPCGCPVCLPRGEIKSRQIRAAYQRDD